MLRADSLRRPLYPIVFLGLTLVFLTAHLYAQRPAGAADTSSCKPVYMYPSYARIKAFDESHSKYAAKYSLYLYREQGKDAVPGAVGAGLGTLRGVPVLFVPGNAGSYRQVRSLAAECAALHHDANIDVVHNARGRSLDFFAADFNEDYTAFHGRTLLDQAEYLNAAVRFILLLYAPAADAPAAVMLVAHSMGGVVARVMPTLASCPRGSISTLVTLAAPHAAAPLTFDGDLLRLYLAADRVWHAAFAGSAPAHAWLRDVAVVSITGGAADAILPADYTSLGAVVPASNALTVYTSGIPGVWTPMDHLAIVWCRQLRRSVLRALLQIVDAASPLRVCPLHDRMAVFRQNLLSGFEAAPEGSRAGREALFSLRFDVQDAVLHSGATAIWKSSAPVSPRALAFSLLPLTAASTALLLTDTAPPAGDPLAQIRAAPHCVFLCKKRGAAAADAAPAVDLTGPATKEFMELLCASAAARYNEIPKSSAHVASLEDSAFDGGAAPFWAAHLSSDDVRDFDTLLVVSNREHAGAHDGFMVAQTSARDASTYVVGTDMLSLITRGADVSLLATRPLAVNLNVPGAWSSLLAYRVDLKETSGPLFEPFIRQWVEDPYETKWLIKLRGRSTLLVTMHGVAPFTPFPSYKPGLGLNLQLWSDPQGGWSDDNVAAVELAISVDWLGSLRLLVVRYRLAVVSHCLAVTVLVAILQFRKYSVSGRFPDYVYGLSSVCSVQIFVPTLLALWVLSPVTKIRAVQYALNLVDPVVLQDPNEINLSIQDGYRLNSFYLGLEENCLAFIGPMFYIMAIGINFLTYHALTTIGLLVVGLINPAPRGKTWGKKVVASAALLLLIPFYLPYQFAYVISFVIHTTTCIKILLDNPSRSCWNFNMSILMMMAWVLPINIPVLIVFVHNLNVSWATPFSSHHNFLAVAPVLTMVELCSYFGNSLPLGSDTGDKAKDRWISKISFVSLAYLGVYCIVYGTRHTFWLHHLFNFWCCSVCLMVINYFNGDVPEKIK
ncbi:PGAP1-domain-containing protein [Metschnikowia bicuspidata var. bicuspidata NRRL YB-4993]|uniref:GPI inositol-deacylase n=1 Tax=Metschnikowia bicuspidata var. bicuspidata NRRL YB-4993 TaxID=869754 RepID=A0A1A0HBI5_9ASCO|nr:PGAP1-domain-containing protein [Metschnikowia bicuspidata var. bicuspidata NRRL YB-4993]OBA21499.1 PGAP1-domain-containing protein [Metschnikowia bicuspidata var. bicuspidata NRRL YB-4993]